jgi:hypothetical protein
MKIASSNCRTNCARVLLTEAVSVAAPAIQPPLVTGLRGDKDCRIWLAQASSTSPSALGENLLSAIPKTVKGQIAEDGLLNDIAPPTGIGL